MVPIKLRVRIRKKRIAFCNISESPLILVCMGNAQASLTWECLLSSENFSENQKRAANDNDEQGDSEQEGEDRLQNLEKNQDTYNENDDPENDK